MRTQQVVPAGVLNIKKVILGSDFTQRQNLDAVGLTARRVHKQVKKVTGGYYLQH